MFDAGDFEVAHDHLTVLIVLAQGAILLVKVRQRAQLVLRACTDWGEKDREGYIRVGEYDLSRAKTHFIRSLSL